MRIATQYRDSTAQYRDQYRDDFRDRGTASALFYGVFASSTARYRDLSHIFRVCVRARLRAPARARTRDTHTKNVAMIAVHRGTDRGNPAKDATSGTAVHLFIAVLIAVLRGTRPPQHHVAMRSDSREVAA